MSSARPTTLPPTAEAPNTRVLGVLSLAALVVIVLAAAYFRIYKIDVKSFWIDEGVSAAFTRLGWYDLARILWRREANMSLYYLLLRAWTQLGDSVAWIRGLSALFSLATVPVLYALGRRLFGTVAAFAAALLLAVNAYAVRYAQEARSYSLATLLVTLATFLLVRAVAGGRRRDWTWYILSSVLAVYAHFFAVLVVVAHGVAMRAFHVTPKAIEGASRSPSREFTRAGRLIGLWTLPLWLFIGTTGAGPIKWIARPGWAELRTFFEQLSGHGSGPLFWLYFAGVVLAVIAGVRAWRSSPGQGWPYGLLLSWFAVPLIITLAVSMLRPVFLPRYLIVCLPALVLLVAVGLTSFRNRWMAAPVLALVLWFAVQGSRAYYRQDFDIGRQDFKQLTTYLLDHDQPGDAVVFYDAQARFPYSYYAAREASPGRPQPEILFPGGQRPTWRDFMGHATPELLPALAQHPRLWLVLVENGGPEDAAARQLQAALSSSYTLVEQRDFPFLRLCLYAAKTTG